MLVEGVEHFHPYGRLTIAAVQIAQHCQRQRRVIPLIALLRFRSPDQFPQRQAPEVVFADSGDGGEFSDSSPRISISFVSSWLNARSCVFAKTRSTVL